VSIEKGPELGFSSGSTTEIAQLQRIEDQLLKLLKKDFNNAAIMIIEIHKLLPQLSKRVAWFYTEHVLLDSRTPIEVLESRKWENTYHALRDDELRGQL
jgi:hypothetical protein